MKKSNILSLMESNNIMTRSKHYTKRCLALVVIVISTASCTHVYYAPNTANVPLLSEKGEVKVNALYSSGGDSEFEGGEVQAAAAVSKHVAVMFNSMFAGKTQQVDEGVYGSYAHEESGKGSYIEFAGGLFTAFDPKQRCIGEVYAGIGSGSVNSEYGSGLNSKVGVTKLFVQPSVGYKSKYFEASLAPKISFVNWKVKSENGLNTNDIDWSDLETVKRNPNFVSLEPTFLVRAGGEYFKLQGSLSFGSSHGGYPAETLNASIGLSVNFKPKKN